MIKFSIITVCLNAGQDLIDTVTNSLNQSYKNFEIIVKDGLSQDGSIEKLPKDSRIKLIQKFDTGIYDAMNQGIEVATGDYLIFINAGDSFYERETLAKLEKEISKLYSDFYYGHIYNETLKIFSNSPKKLTSFFCYRSMICHQAMVFKRECIQKRYYDCNFNVSADREMLMYIVVKTKLLTNYVPLTIARYKGSGFCESEQNQKNINNECLKLKSKYYTKKQRFIYKFIIELTLPDLRKKILKNPKLVRIYKYFVGCVYRNRQGA